MCVSYRRPLAIAKSASPFEFPPKDVAEMLQDKKLAIVDTPVDNCVVFIDMNVKTPRLTSYKVWQAVAYAISYQKIMSAAMFGRGAPMLGSPAEITSPAWPQPRPHATVTRTLPRESSSAHRVVTAIGVGALQYQASRLRCRVRIPQGPTPHAAGQLGVSRERSPRVERQSRYT